MVKSKYFATSVILLKTFCSIILFQLMWPPPRFFLNSSYFVTSIFSLLKPFVLNLEFCSLNVAHLKFSNELFCLFPSMWSTVGLFNGFGIKVSATNLCKVLFLYPPFSGYLQCLIADVYFSL